MRAGKLRHRVTFQRATIAQDAFGEPDQTWADLCTSWGLVKAVKGSEGFSTNQVQAGIDYMITTRYRSELSDLAPDDRATWNGNTYDIKSVITRDTRARELEITAVKHL